MKYKKSLAPLWGIPFLIILLIAFATRGDNTVVKKSTLTTSDVFLKKLYAQIDFDTANLLSFDAFQFAVKGFYSIKASGKLNPSKELLSICDFSLSANKKRLWIIDMEHLKLLVNDFVAHGQGTGEEFATDFSNKENSHQSSLGFYVTGITYNGQHGLSLYLHGLDQGYNSAAYERSIVMHGANYVSEDFIAKNQRLGRSWGCPAISSAIAPKVIDLAKDSTCMFIYYPDPAYLSTAYWLNKKDNSLEMAMEKYKFNLDPALVIKDVQFVGKKI